MNKVAGVLLLLLWSPLPAAPGSWQSPLAEPVSYTHLTLPTKA